MGGILRKGGGVLHPEDGDLKLDGAWGALQSNAVMPGSGRLEKRPYSSAERAAVEEGAANLGLDGSQALKVLGNETLDVELNDVAYWSNVPSGVWEYTVGGFQVIKKWLSYRSAPVLGRAMTTEEARDVTAMVRRIAAVLLLGASLDRNYEQVRRTAFRWSDA